MKHLYILALFFCLASLTACEKPLLAEDEIEQVDNNKSDKKSDDNSSGNTDKGSTEDTGSGSSDDKTGGDNSGGSTSENDSIVYPDNGTSGSIETDIVDGNEDTDKKEEPSTSGLTVQGETAYSVSEFLTTDFSGSIWVVGYIVGDCTQNIKNANFTPPFSQHQAILLADDPNERNTDNMIAVQLNSETRQKEYSLEAHPENQGKKRFAVCGYQTKYLGIPGMKSKNSGISSMQWYDE